MEFKEFKEFKEYEEFKEHCHEQPGQAISAKTGLGLQSHLIPKA
jgi:hypothetical protein